MDNNNPNANNKEKFDDTIVRGASNTAIISFSQNLISAFDHQYAMIHGVVGSDYAYNSTIRVSITVFRGKTTPDGKKPYAYVNLDVSECKRLREIVRHCITEKSFMQSEKVQPNQNNNQQGGNGKIYQLDEEKIKNIAISKKYLSAAYKKVKALSEVEYLEGKDLEDALEQIESSGKKIGELIETIRNCSSSTISTPTATTSAKSLDFNERILKVHSHTKDSEGLSPVFDFSISRSEKTASGEVRTYPWFITIKQFKSKAIIKKDKTVNYDSRIVKSLKECTIALNDNDLFRCFDMVCTFIDMWEMTTGQRLLNNAMRQKAAEAKKKKQQEEQKQREMEQAQGQQEQAQQARAQLEAQQQSIGTDSPFD